MLYYIMLYHMPHYTIPILILIVILILILIFIMLINFFMKKAFAQGGPRGSSRPSRNRGRTETGLMRV